MPVMKKICLFLLLGAVVIAAQESQPKTFPPTAEQRTQIDAKLADLTRRIDALTAKKVDAQLLADVLIYQKAAQYILRFPEEFFRAPYAAETIAVLDMGLARAKELESGGSTWTKGTGNVVRGLVSHIDGSVQPYGLTIPASYDGSKPMRLDVWLHGTQLELNEVHFIAQQARAHGDTNAPAVQDYIQLEPLGRMNLSYRYAGETDVFEAIASVQKRYNIDSKRILIRGHSMGGQGAWRLGLQHPGFFAALEASAGYVDTHEYAGSRSNFPKPLTPYQEAALHYYDAQDYALNAFDIPTVGYGGENDAQLRASVKIREALGKEGFHFTQESPYRWTTKDLRALFLVGPKTGHAWHPDSKVESEAFLRKALETADKAPNHLRCVTYTARFDECRWLGIDALDETYQRAEVDATRTDDLKRYTVTTKNVSRLRFESPAASYTLDGQTVTGGANPTFEKASGKWSVAPAHAAGLRKVHGLQGPIDDAFRDSFVLVRSTGQPWNPAASDYARKRMERFQSDFAKWLRGDVRVQDDAKVTADDIASSNLVLFGDPGSNSLLAKVMAKLPVQWTKTDITVGAQKFPSADHALVMIYPNPLNPQRYVVINTGLTFDPDRVKSGTESLFFPRLGDYAVLSTTGSTAVAGIFDENWKLK
jgi:pimeloyl-ACP methyl ester carboxylesterase